MENQPKSDIQRLKRDLGEAAREARALKAVLCATWSRPMADEQRALAALRVRTTRLCIFRAHLRGRLHVLSVPEPAAYHAKIAARVAREYELSETPCASSTSV